ncbi:MAG: RNP-1 like protein RNA-binding protein [Candidatus Beckwithbacteria bacterium GW2011_GWA2_47_25]|nr:MAG: RNP-1 like protein RNA-binding protein [Candidatus Beckwithbacteria bacterium GW2011_GWA2_47_25]
MDNNKLYVGNLSYTVTTDQLKQHFSQAGTVTDAIVITDKASGRSKGFGFVTMSTPEEMQKAKEMFDGQDLDGRPLRVDVARPPRQDGGG